MSQSQDDEEDENMGNEDQSLHNIRADPEPFGKGNEAQTRPLKTPTFSSTRLKTAKETVSPRSNLIANTGEDEDASAALLMLNKDRRHLGSPEKAKKGLSVMDLLSH